MDASLVCTMCMATATVTTHQHGSYGDLRRGDRVKFATGSPMRIVRNVSTGKPWIPVGCIEVVCTDGYAAHVLSYLPLRVARGF